MAARALIACFRGGVLTDHMPPQAIPTTLMGAHNLSTLLRVLPLVLVAEGQEMLPPAQRTTAAGIDSSPLDMISGSARAERPVPSDFPGDPPTAALSTSCVISCSLRNSRNSSYDGGSEFSHSLRVLASKSSTTKWTKRSVLLEIGRPTPSKAPTVETTPWKIRRRSVAGSDFMRGSAVKAARYDRTRSRLFSKCSVKVCQARSKLSSVDGRSRMSFLASPLTFVYR